MPQNSDIPPSQLPALRAAAGVLKAARKLLVITGAGMSADAGLPTYRGSGGLYQDRLTPDGVAIEEALSGRMLRRNPELTWRYLRQMVVAASGRGPGEGHRALARLEQSGRYAGFWLLTQNVDSLHAAAGSKALIEIHGHFRQLECRACGYQEALTAVPDDPPACPCCQALMRPPIVLFGESLPDPAVTALEQALDSAPDCVVVIGTTAVFPYIYQPVVMAARMGLPTIEINPERTVLSGNVRVHLALRAEPALMWLADRLCPLRGAGPNPWP